MLNQSGSDFVSLTYYDKHLKVKSSKSEVLQSRKKIFSNSKNSTKTVGKQQDEYETVLVISFC